MASRHAGPCPAVEPPPEDRAPLHRLGTSGEPVRVIAFAGGGFDTAIQLGVTHALLAAGGTPPDMVVVTAT